MKESTRIASLLMESSFDYITEKAFVKTLEELYYSAKGTLILPIIEGSDVDSIKKAALKLTEKAKRTDDEDTPLPKKYKKADSISPEGIFVFEGTDLNDLVDAIEDLDDLKKVKAAADKFRKTIVVAK